MFLLAFILAHLSFSTISQIHHTDTNKRTRIPNTPHVWRDVEHSLPASINNTIPVHVPKVQTSPRPRKQTPHPRTIKKARRLFLVIQQVLRVLVFSLGYGKRLVTVHEGELRSIEAIMRDFVGAGVVGRWWVGIFPILDILPRCFAEWKRISTKFHRYESELHIPNLNAVWEY